MASSCNIKVIARFRPMNGREKQETQQSDWVLQFSEGGQTVEASQGPQGKSHHSFTFDAVFDPDALQENIYNLSARPCIQDVLEGYNGTIFAYGQSGSGKTFTMFGPEKPFPDDLKGVIPRASQHIFDHIEADEQMSYAIKCSFLEIYKEHIRDLLAPSAGAGPPQGLSKDNAYLKVRESPTKGVWVDGLTEEFATCEQDIDDLIALGDNSRSVASTGMNQRSSRSHTMFVISIEQKAADGSTKTGRLNLIDLAGSEKISKTGAKGETLEEAKKINQSLSALGKCINALTTGKGHIPYRESKLTRILQESLGGNTKTTLIVTCSPHAYNSEETISTLQFGQRAKTIKNKVQVNRQLSVQELEAELKGIQKDYHAAKMYSVKLEKQVAWMRREDYDASKGMPAELVAVKPVSAAASASALSKKGHAAPPGGAADDADYDSHTSSLEADDDELMVGNEAMAIAETKLELQKLRDEIDMDMAMLKDEILSMQGRLEEKKQQMESIAMDMSRQSVALSTVNAELQKLRHACSAEFSKSLAEKKEKEEEVLELQKEFAKLSEETSRLQGTLGESDENFLVLFTENETIRSLLAAHLQELHNTNQSISDLSRQAEQLSQKAISSRSESEMLERGIENVEKDIVGLENKQHTLDADHKSTADKLGSARDRHKLMVQKVALLTEQLSESQGTLNRHKESLQKIEESIAKYNTLRSTLQGSLQNEATLMQKLKGQSKSLTDITAALCDISKAQAQQAALQETLHATREAITKSEEQYQAAYERNMALEKDTLTLNAATQVAILEKQQLLKTQDVQSTSDDSSSGLLATLAVKLKRLQEEKAALLLELSASKHDEQSLNALDASWASQVQELEAVWKNKERESAKLQANLTKESSKLTTNAALVAQQSALMKQQKERLVVLKGTLKSTRDAHTAVHAEADVVVQKRDELEKVLADKERLRHEAQRNAVEASRLREQMLQRRRIAMRSTPAKKGGLLEAFQQKVDIESQRAGLKSTGSLFLQEARDEHFRGLSGATAGADKVVSSISPSARKRMSLARRQSFSVDTLSLGTVRIGGVKLTAGEIAMYEQMFSHYDKDKSGSIDSNELMALLSELGVKVSDELMAPLMKELDKDGNGQIEFPEFLHGMDYLNNLSTNI